MNWAWAPSLDQIWRSPTFPMWLTLAAAGFFGIIVLITLLRAEKSVANGALTVITLLAIAVAVAATIRGFGPGGQVGSAESSSPQAMNVTLPALACVDDLAGDAVLAACEKALFGSAESSAAAVSYAASQISRLTALGDVATANKNLTPELQALRHAVEHDRYGLMAYALVARDHCTPSDCAAFRALTDSHQIAANMDERVYDGLISRYASTWNAPPVPAPVAALIPGVPTGRPTNAEFPTAASTPPVSIMTPEPVAPAARPSAPKQPVATAAAPVPLSPPPGAPTPTLAAAKKPPAPKPPRAAAPASAPVSIAPPQAPAASND
ncbi:hypothetical protein [Bradyrhizobium sp. dw_411]|uniref:hypothetical protein n=1 Tax=Bradyrhizobium sp. dw_411 TaxID=2720082 RepID=UPI001BCC80B7|nr:hypothetical protein [Bradyrhizobium sp. dw_411]